MIAGIVLAVGVLGGGGYYAYNEFIVKKSEPTAGPVAMGSGSGSATGSDPVGTGRDGSGSAAGVGSESGSGSGSTERAAAGSDTAGSAEGSAIAAGSDAAGSGSADGSNAAGSGSADGSNAASGSIADGSNAGSGSDSGGNTVQPAQKSDQLEITSTPPGARVFLDGAELGKSPVKQPGSADRHTLAVLLPGHSLYVAEVDGAGDYNITRDPVNPAR
jgi:hypothetical protein